MDLTDDERYAFLLGSALRNEDPDQLFVVYDSLIPEDIPQSRLEQIKERARHISELPEPEFNTIVVNARNYSLALGHSSMNQTSGHNRVQSSGYQSEDSVTQSCKQNIQIENYVTDPTEDCSSPCHFATSSSFNKSHSDVFFSNDFSVKIDIGVIEESKDGDSGLQDSLYKLSSLKNSTSCSDSTYGDSEEDRPGSFDYMPLQSHVRIVHSFHPSYDEEVRVDSGTDGSSVESPRSETSVTHDEYNLTEEGTEMATISYKETPRPYSRERRHSDDCWHYILGGKRDEDGEDDYGDLIQSSQSGSSYVSTFSRETPTQVDKAISYSLKNLDDDSGPVQPRQKLFTPNYLYKDHYKLLESKNKLNSYSQDDSDKPDVPGLVDINGNPKALDTANNSQMHQLPRGKSENTAAASGSSSASFTTATVSQSSSADSNVLDRKKERKRMKQQRQRWTSAEAYEDHKDFKDITEILDFVEGPHSASKSEGKTAKRKQERNKKKDQQLNGPLASEDIVGGEDGPDCMETIVVTIKPGLEAMGNSSGKSLDDNNISRAESSEDNCDKNSEFHDCLNTLPTELVIQDKVELDQLVSKSDNTLQSSIHLEGDKNDLSLKGHNNIEKILTDNVKIVNKKSTKVKSKKDKQELTKDNGLVSRTAFTVKSKENPTMKDAISFKSVIPKDKRNIHCSSDTELPSEGKREDSFTEVKKRKKRPLGKDFINFSTNHSGTQSYQSHSINGHPHSNNPRPRPFTPPLLPATTSVAGNVSSLPVSNHVLSNRDLSPSAFPLLPGHGSLANSSDNRRNSCGDISIDSVDNKIYDSDRESAKSLPDACGARVPGDLSPIYPLSYARIAAAPRKNDNTNSPSSESGVTSGSQNSSISSSVTHTPSSSIDIVSPQSPSKASVVPERKTTVWKGSPRERRHSIGSSPEDKEDKDKASVTQCNRQCGSQEVLSRDAGSSSKSSTNVTVSSLPGKDTYNTENFNDIELDTAATQEPGEKQFSNNPKSTITSAQSEIRSPAQNLSKQPSFEYAASSCQTQGCTVSMPSKQTVSDSIKTRDHMRIELNPTKAATDLNKSKKEMPSQDIVSSNISIHSEDNGIKATLGKQKVNSTSRPTGKPSGGSNNTKSVIFLDKRFGASSPQNLGITFGFDLSFEATPDPASQSTNQQRQPALTSMPQFITSTLSSSSSSGSVVSSISSSAQSLCSPQALHHIPSAAETVVEPSKQSHISPSQPSDYNNSPLPKVSHIQGLCNGLILPSISTTEHDDTTNKSSNNSNISLCNDNVNTNSQLSNNRTSQFTTNQCAQVTPNIISPQATSDLSSSSTANSSPAQSNKPTLCKSNVIIPQTSPIGVAFSPNLPPPPLPYGTPAITGDNKTSICKTTDKVNSTSASPLTQETQEQNDLSCPGPTQTASICAPSNPAQTAEATDVEIPTTTTKMLVTQPPPESDETALQKQQQSLPVVQAEVFHVVYGEKIKPVIGCGKLIFNNHIISQNNKGHSADLANFLKKKWLEDVSMKKGPCAFITLNED